MRAVLAQMFGVAGMMREGAAGGKSETDCRMVSRYGAARGREGERRRKGEGKEKDWRAQTRLSIVRPGLEPGLSS